MKKIFLINTSNRQKLHELKVLFNKYGIEVNASNIDIKEIDADPLIVILHKASQLDDNIIVEDVSLEVESSNIGVNIRWRLDKLKELKGYKAKFIVMLAVKQGNKVKIYKGEVAGEIAERKGIDGFGFDAYFRPIGATKTLAEAKPDCYNARALAVKDLIEEKVYYEGSVITDWIGKWQGY